MKTQLTLLSIFAAASFNMMFAQSGPMTVKLMCTDSTTSANGPQTAPLMFSFTGSGKDSLDANDMGDIVTTSTGRDYCSPFSVSSEGSFLAAVDHRQFLTEPRSIPFGIFSKDPATVSLTTYAFYSAPDPAASVNNANIGNIYIEDLTTGIKYDIFGSSVGLTIPVNTLPTCNYSLHLYPAMQIASTDEVCYGASNGTMHILNPGSSSWTLELSGPMGSSTTSIYQDDTTLTSLMAGTYTVKSYVNGLLSNSQTVIVDSYAPVVPVFTPSTTTEGQNINIDFNNNTGSGMTWQWNMGDGNTFTCENVIHNYLSAGSYTVSLTATDVNGCQGTSTAAIEITLLPPSAPPSFWNPNGPVGREVITDRGETNTTQRNGNTIVVTQNGEIQPAQIDIYTINGQLVASEKPTSTVTEINVAQGGCYLVVTTLPNGEVKSERIVLGL